MPAKRRTTAGAAGRSSSTANDAGAGAANTEPPSGSASTNENEENGTQVRRADFNSVADELSGYIASDPAEGEGEEYFIIRQYRGMLEAIRKLPRLMRPRARFEASKWLRSSLKALKERRAIERSAKRDERRKKIRRHDVPKRRPPGLNYL